MAYNNNFNSCNDYCYRIDKKNEYTNIIEFTNNFVDEFEVGENKTRFGAVSFATTIENEFQLTDYYNASSIKYHFDTIMTKSGNGIWTNTPEAIDLVRTNILLKGRNKTTSVVLITDGSPKLKNKSSKSMRILTRTAIKKLRLDYPWVNIYSVGIGMKKSGKNLLKQISDTNNVFNVDDFSDLSTILNNVTDALCI